MENKSQITGRSGEEAARSYLRQNGHEILETNWRFKKYEVDIISKSGSTIVFVEVKTRKSDTFGEPELFVDRKKQNFLVAAAHQYITQNNIDLESRFDIVAVLQQNNSQTVKHLPAAFYPLVK
jgi:putative endonuclease